MSSPATSDDELTRRLRAAVRRVKRVMRYRGSLETDDFVDELVARWVARGDLAAMREARAGYLAVAVRNHILDAIAHRGRRPSGTPDALETLELPPTEDLARLVDVHLSYGLAPATAIATQTSPDCPVGAPVGGSCRGISRGLLTR